MRAEVPVARYWRVGVAILGLLGLGLAGGCGTRQTEPEFIFGVPSVDSVEVVLPQGTETRVTVVVRGTVRDPCTRISSVKQSLVGRVLTIALTTRRALADSCLDSETPFEATVPLVERGLQAGLYTVECGDVSAPFLFRSNGGPEL